MQFHTKHLSVVEATANDAMSHIESTYGVAKSKALSYSPEAVTSMVRAIESYTVPFINFGKNASIKALLYADSSVGTGMNVATSAVKYTRKQAGWLVGDDRLKPLDDSVKVASERLNEAVKCIEKRGIVGATKVGISELWQASAKGASSAKAGLRDLNHTLSDCTIAAKKKLATVKSSLVKEYLKPTVNAVYQRASTAREWLVKKPLYATLHGYFVKAVHSAGSLSVVRTPFTFFKAQLYPVIEPFVGPYIDAATPYVSDIQKGMEPQAQPIAVEKVVANTATDVKKAVNRTAAKVKGDAQEKAKGVQNATAN